MKKKGRFFSIEYFDKMPKRTLAFFPQVEIRIRILTASNYLYIGRVPQDTSCMGPFKNIVHLFFREGDKGHGNKAFLRQHDIRQSDLVLLDRFRLDEKGEKG